MVVAPFDRAPYQKCMRALRLTMHAFAHAIFVCAQKLRSITFAIITVKKREQRRR